MSVTIAALYAGLNALIMLVLALLVVRQRAKTKTMLGSGGHAALERAIRVHGNCVEYVPTILILLLIMDMGRVGSIWLHAMGITITLGRILHAWGLSRTEGESFGRAAGIILTWLAMIGGIIGTLSIGLYAL